MTVNNILIHFANLLSNKQIKMKMKRQARVGKKEKERFGFLHLIEQINLLIL